MPVEGVDLLARQHVPGTTEAVSAGSEQQTGRAGEGDRGRAEESILVWRRRTRELKGTEGIGPTQVPQLAGTVAACSGKLKRRGLLGDSRRGD